VSGADPGNGVTVAEPAPVSVTEDVTGPTPDSSGSVEPEQDAPVKRATRRRTSRPRPARATADAIAEAVPTADDATGPAGAGPSETAGLPQTETPVGEAEGPAPDAGEAEPARVPARRRRTRRAVAAEATVAVEDVPQSQPSTGTADAPVEANPVPDAGETPPEPAPAKRRRTRRATAEKTTVVAAEPAPSAAPETTGVAEVVEDAEGETTEPASSVAESASSAAGPAVDTGSAATGRAGTARAGGSGADRRRPPLGTTMVLFQPPEPPPARRSTSRSVAASWGQTDDPELTGTPAEEDEAPAPSQGTDGEGVTRRRRDRSRAAKVVVPEPDEDENDLVEDGVVEDESDDDEPAESRRRRRRRGGRGRRGRSRTANGDGEDPGAEAEDAEAEEDESAESDGPAQDGEEADAEVTSGSSRRRRRRRRRGAGADADAAPDDPPNTVVRVREPRRGGAEDVSSIKGSTRLEAKKQRRREGREAGRRRTVITEAEFLARRESVERVMAVRERGGRTQIVVLEDGVLVEHYVARQSQVSTVGNVYLGKVQNVLPSMEAAFIDIGKGRNAVLYAGEVNWDAAGMEGQPRRIEHALKSGESVLVQVTKDPIGHKGARLTSQISLPGRYLVYVPDGTMTGISRKLPDTERTRLKRILRQIVPEDAGVIVRTAAEGASEEELARDVARLRAQWEDISRKAGAVNAPALLYGEPDLAIRVVRDIFNEDFSRLVVAGQETWETLEAYIGHVAPDLVDRLQKWTEDEDVFGAHRVDEQLAKGLERKVWLPSGGSLIIDRTEAMTVVDVNTGKFTGTGGNLEETVTRNNLEAAEEIVRQLRLRDIGGIIVVDFIDMVLESNRELVLRRLLECLGRDRTKHQVAEVTSLGLVQMTRKRVGQGLLEAFSETCEHCAGRGLLIREEPVEKRASQQEGGRSGGRSRSGRGQSGSGNTAGHNGRAAATTEQSGTGTEGGGDTRVPEPSATGS
jgi:ribonuclease E